MVISIGQHLVLKTLNIIIKLQKEKKKPFFVLFLYILLAVIQFFIKKIATLAKENKFQNKQYF